MRRLLLLTACLFAFQAHSAAITITALGKNRVTAATTNPITTSADCPVGSIEVLAATDTTVADTLTGVTDSGSNTWTVIENIIGTGVLTAWAYTPNATTGDVASGGTITATFGGSSISSVAAACLANVATTGSLDKHNLSDQGVAATASNTVNSGTLAVGNEIVMAAVGSAVAAGTYACLGGVNTLLQQSNSAQLPTIGMCYAIKTLGSTVSLSSSMSWTNSSAYVTDLISLMPPSGGSSLLTLGVGP